MNWLNCELIYDKKSNKIKNSIEENKLKKLKKYQNKFFGNLKYNAWYDNEEDIVFGADETYLTSKIPNHATFLDSVERFLENDKYGVQSLRNYMYLFDGNTKFSYHNDGYYQLIKDIDKYRNSTILIVGGGPSAKKSQWKDEKADFIWSCNDFYLNEDLTSKKIDLFYVNSTNSCEIQELKRIIKRDDPVCAICTSITRDKNMLASYKKNNFKTLLFGTRMFSSLGAVPKLINLAVLFGAAEIKFVGFDGWTQEEFANKVQKQHSFKKDGTYFKISSTYTYHAQRRELVVMWDYFLNHLSESSIKYKNLGYTYEDNLSSKIPLQINKHNV